MSSWWVVLLDGAITDWNFVEQMCEYFCFNDENQISNSDYHQETPFDLMYMYQDRNHCSRRIWTTTFSDFGLHTLDWLRLLH